MVGNLTLRDVLFEFLRTGQLINEVYTTTSNYELIGVRVTQVHGDFAVFNTLGSPRPEEYIVPFNQITGLSSYRIPVPAE